MRQGMGYYMDWVAGVLTETDEGDYTFEMR
jgi:hypothetical protein